MTNQFGGCKPPKQKIFIKQESDGKYERMEIDL